MSFGECTCRDGVARVTLDRPPLNVLDLEAARALAAALESLGARDDVALVVLGARGKAFCAGVDVRDHLPDRGAEMLAEFHRVCRLLHGLEAPVLAAVQGPALGGGCELTLVCDLVIASARATFGQPEIRLGVFPPLAAAALPERVPPHVASDLVLTGRILSSEEALRWGIASRVVADDRFGETLESWIADLRALSPSSLRLAKRALRLAGSRPAAEAVENAERLYVDELMRSPDAIEGLTAFLEKRPPRWPGATATARRR